MSRFEISPLILVSKPTVGLQNNPTVGVKLMIEFRDKYYVSKSNEILFFINKSLSLSF